MENQGSQALCDELFQAHKAGDFQNLYSIVPNLSSSDKLDQIRLVTAKRDGAETPEEIRSAANFLLGLLESPTN